jgi:5-methylcytosine-specific restriction endonuclease McrA
MNFELINTELAIGLSGKEKKKIRQEQRKNRLEQAKERTRRGENYGDIKVSRRIPREIIQQVQARDRGRDFGRPNHICEIPGPPHHIVRFEKYLNYEVEGDPHTVDNLEAPCNECHVLAHKMGIADGISIEAFFREKFSEKNK